jgi:single-stranded DNA-binding protein
MSGFDINTVTVSGNLTREPELRNLPNSDQSV